MGVRVRVRVRLSVRVPSSLGVRGALTQTLSLA